MRRLGDDRRRVLAMPRPWATGRILQVLLTSEGRSLIAQSRTEGREIMSTSPATAVEKYITVEEFDKIFEDPTAVVRTNDAATAEPD